MTEGIRVRAVSYLAVRTIAGNDASAYGQGRPIPAEIANDERDLAVCSDGCGRNDEEHQRSRQSERTAGHCVTWMLCRHQAYLATLTGRGRRGEGAGLRSYLA